MLNIEGTLKSIATALEAAELMSGIDIKGVTLALSGANVESFNTTGQVAVTGKGREITQDDIARVHEAAKAVSISMERQILHTIPQTYKVDDEPDIRNPLHMSGVRLECSMHIITGSSTTIQNMLKCVSRAGYHVDGTYLGILGAARSVLSEDERELGCLLLDIGGGTTDIMVFSDGQPVLTSSIPAGGSQVTGDISIMLSVPVETAEKLKRESASCWIEAVDPDETVIIPPFGAREPAELERRKLVSIIQPRMEEILSMARDRVEKSGMLDRVKAGVVLTGGTAEMPQIEELAQSIFGLPVRVGYPVSCGGMEEAYRSPAFAASVGIAMMEADIIAAHMEAAPRKGKRRERRSQGGILRWFKDRFF